MHEMALAEGILAVVLDVADGQKVRRVCLQVGKLLMVVPDSLQFSFQLVADGTPAAAAVLEMEEVPACWRCKQCGAESDPDLQPLHCQGCGASEVEAISGDELLVDAVELETGVNIRRRSAPANDIPEEYLIEREIHDAERHADDESHAPDGRKF